MLIVNNVKNLLETAVQHLAFRETNNSILTATYQVPPTYIVLIVSAEILEREGPSIHPPFTGNFPTISHKCLPYLSRRWVFLFVFGVAEQDKNAG